MDDLITKALQDKSKKMLKKAEKKTSRAIDDLDAAGIFGIDMEEKAGLEKAPRRRSAKKTKTAKNKPKMKKSPQ
jgi:hypothetical protein